jgi:pyrroloquinoline quinone biosynthesis protein E
MRPLGPQSRPRLAAKARLKWDAREHKFLLLYPERGLLLNETAAAIVQLCDGSRTIEDIARALAEDDGGDAADTLRESLTFLGELRARALLDSPEDASRSDAGDATSARSDGETLRAPCEARPFTLIAELTYRCPLACPYCSNPLDLSRYSKELTTDEWSRVFEQAEALGVVQLHLTGGEPLARKDLAELARRSRGLGLYTNLITSGIPLQRERLLELRDAGIDNVQLSFQDATADSADTIAGYPAMTRKLEVARWVKEAGLPLTFNVVLHRGNIDRIAELIALAERVDADRLELASAQYHGWALANRDALLPTELQFARAQPIALAAKARLKGKIEVLYVKTDYFSEFPKACMDGWARRFVHVVPSGEVLPCHAAMQITNLRFENVRDRPLSWIWNESPSMNAFRGEAWMPEPCRSCDRRSVDFGGCRCQAFALTGRADATDPACSLSPDRHLVVAARAKAAAPSVRYLYRGRDRVA